ncbi:MAG: phage baseplate assembly protein V, partial [Paraburkholderia sp.]|nr:phage baseplate assembly protein V [Paraburkholderia sp.]
AKLRALFDAGAAREQAAAPARASATPGLLAGEVTDTHHPDSPGRVRVRWLSSHGEAVERWLQCLRGQRPRMGDRVLVEQPANWPEPLVTGILAAGAGGGAGSGEAVEPDPGPHPSQTLKLAPEECVRIDDANGTPLVQILASSAGPVVRLMSPDVSLEAAGKLSLRAQTLELEAGRGGVDIRTEADTLVRSRYIRLN